MRGNRGRNLLREKVIIVTGGTQGLGKSIALHLSACGAKGIVICGRNRENGEASAREILDSGCSCEFIQADLTIEEDCRKIVRACMVQHRGKNQASIGDNEFAD
jgi:hypothetical protein